MADDPTPDSAPDSAPDPAARRRPDSLWATLRRFGRLWGFLAFLVFVVVLFRGIVLPFIFAFLIAYLLAPVVDRMEPRTTRGGAVVLVYLVIVAVFAVFVGLLLPPLGQDLARLRDAAPDIMAKVSEEWIPQVSGWIERSFPDLLFRPEPEAPTNTELVMTPLADGSWRVDLNGVNLQVEEAGDGRWIIGPSSAETPDELGEQIRHLLATKGAQLTTAVGPVVQSLIAGVTGFLTGLLVTFMLAAFVLIDIARVNRAIRSLIPLEYRHNFDEIMSGMDRGLAGVIRGQLLICGVNGLLTYLGLVLIGVKYSILLAVFAAVLSLIPIFGTIVSSVPIVLVALVSQENGVSLTPAIMVLLWISGIHLLEANVLNPKIIGDSAHIHPVIVVFALLAGQATYGLVGALLAVPVASMVQTVFLYARRRSDVFERGPEGAS